MITLNDCTALCGLTEREGTRIAEHEHLPEVAILTYIKPNGPRCKTLRERLLSIAPLAGFPVTEQPKLRFAVGTFDSWPQLREALCELRDRGLVLDSFNCLALQRLFAGKTLIAPNQEPVGVEALPFAEGTALIACTSGPLAACSGVGSYRGTQLISRMPSRPARSCSGSGLPMNTMSDAPITSSSPTAPIPWACMISRLLVRDNARHKGRSMTAPLLPAATASLLVLLVADMASAQDQAKGRSLAVSLCAHCHMNEGQGEKRNPMEVPGFRAIADRPDQSMRGIVTWLRSVPPMMPNHHLSQDEMYDLAAFILSLRQQSGR